MSIRLHPAFGFKRVVFIHSVVLILLFFCFCFFDDIGQHVVLFSGSGLFLRCCVPLEYGTFSKLRECAELCPFGLETHWPLAYDPEWNQALGEVTRLCARTQLFDISAAIKTCGFKKLKLHNASLINGALLSNSFALISNIWMQTSWLLKWPLSGEVILQIDTLLSSYYPETQTDQKEQ